MIKLEEIKIMDIVPAYRIYSDRDVLLKNLISNKQFPSFISTNETPNLSNYVETDISIKQYELKNKYDQKVKRMIRSEYSIDDEFQLVNERYTEPEKYKAYRDRVEQIKLDVKKELGL